MLVARPQQYPSPSPVKHLACAQGPALSPSVIRQLPADRIQSSGYKSLRPPSATLSQSGSNGTPTSMPASGAKVGKGMELRASLKAPAGLKDSSSIQDFKTRISSTQDLKPRSLATALQDVQPRQSATDLKPRAERNESSPKLPIQSSPQLPTRPAPVAKMQQGRGSLPVPASKVHQHEVSRQVSCAPIKPTYPSLLSRSPSKETPILAFPVKDQSTGKETTTFHLPPSNACGDAGTFVPCCGHNAVFTATDAESKVLLATITSLLLSGSDLKSIVRQCFAAVAFASPCTSEQTVADDQGITVHKASKFRSVLAHALGVPETVFPDIKRQHLRFDLEGRGKLREFDMYRLVKMNLWEHRKKLAMYSSGVTIPDKSLASCYDILDQLGKGNQCKANLGKDRTGQLWCVKTYDKARMKSLDVEGVKEEYEVLQHLGKHKNIAAVCELFQDSNFYYMVQELNRGKDFTVLKKSATDLGVMTTENWWRDIFRQCFEGLAHIHQHALMHGDIKESNIMLKTDRYDQPEVVIIDFGLMQTAVSDASVVWGTPGYIAPETWETGKTYPGGDIFAMGVVMMQMLLNKIPPHHNPPRAEILPGGIFTEGLKTMQEVGIFTRARTPPFDTLSEELPQLTLLTRALLEKDVQKRPGALQVLKDTWFVSDTDVFSDLFRRWFG